MGSTHDPIALGNVARGDEWIGKRRLTELDQWSSAEFCRRQCAALSPESLVDSVEFPSGKLVASSSPSTAQVATA